MSITIIIILIIAGVSGVVASTYTILRYFNEQRANIKGLKADAVRMRKDYAKLLKIKKRLDAKLISAQGQLKRIPARPRKKKPTRTSKKTTIMRREKDAVRNHIKKFIK